MLPKDDDRFSKVVMSIHFKAGNLLLYSPFGFLHLGVLKELHRKLTL